MPYIGRSTEAFGVRSRFTFLASADDTSVSGNDVNGLPLSFTDGAYVDVFLNGVRLKHNTDYVTTTANTISSLAALASNDEIEARGVKLAIIKAEDGQGTDATALVIAKGGTLTANGTAESPIVFTDKADQLSYSNTDRISPNRVATDTGKWGGVIILGQATVGEDGGEDDIEGIATGYEWTKYGGSLDTDSSGTLNYISIRHSGTALGNGDEIQGLTLGGVGSGTTVTNIEIVGSDDDGIEIFGGTVNVTNLTIWAQSDDAVDLDEGYAGTIDNVAVQMKASGDNIFEIDGTEDSTDERDGQFTLKNVTFIGVAGNTEKTDQLGHWKSDATGTTENVLYTTMDGQTIEGIDSDTYDASATENAVNKLIFKNFQFATTSTLASILANTSSTTGDAPGWASVVSTGTVGADTSVMSWTMWYKLTQQ